MNLTKYICLEFSWERIFNLIEFLDQLYLQIHEGILNLKLCSYLYLCHLQACQYRIDLLTDIVQNIFDIKRYTEVLCIGLCTET